MHPVEFPGSTEVKKPADMTDEECFSIYASKGIDHAGFPYYLTAWKPSYEDLQALREVNPST